MDEEEKPFPIELIVILIIVALANDVAEVFFDILDFTGVGVSGEAIMVPADFILDLFFTGIFIWRVGFGGGTITQYIDDLLEPFLIPGRTISVGVGIWIANHPKSVVGSVANQVAQLEGGEVGGEIGALKEAEGTVGVVGAEAEAGAQAAGGELEGETTNGSGEGKSKSDKEGGSKSGSESTENENTADDEGEKGGSDAKDEMESPEERDPTENLREQLLAPSEGEDFPQETEEDDEPEESPKPKKVVDISSKQSSQSQNDDPSNVINIEDYRKKKDDDSQSHRKAA